MNRICGIYKITSPSGGIYIGQSRNITSRKSQYKKNFGKGQHRLYNSIMKYGWDVHIFEVIHECEESELNMLEKYYIKYYDTFNTELGMNLTTGGDYTLISNESKKRMSDAKKGTKLWLGKKHSNKSKEKMSKAHMGNKNNLGLKRSNESKEKMSNARKGIKLSEKHRLNIINALIGRKCSEETKRKISTTHRINKRNIGKIMPEETKIKIRATNTGKKRSPESCERIRLANIGKRHSDESKIKISQATKNRAGSFEIYNQNNELIHKFHSNIRLELKKLGYPRERFLNSYKNKCKIKNKPYVDWYVIKL